MKVLFAVSEAFPFVKTGGVGDVAFALPQELIHQGVDVRVILPLYDVIPEHYRDRMELLTNFTFKLSYHTMYCGLYRLEYAGVHFYFIENDTYFMRGALGGFVDDDVRSAFLCRAVCESIRYMHDEMDWTPDIVHCNDWETGLIPFYLRDSSMRHPERERIKTVFTIHNVEYQGSFSYHSLTDAFGLSGILFSEGTMELDGQVNLMKGAMEVSDLVTTVSEGYARDLAGSPDAGALGELISNYKIVGICNGVHRLLNPADSRLISVNYTADTIEKKLENKRFLQKKHGLAPADDAPLMGCVSRLMERKGFSLMLVVLPEFLKAGAQFVLTGDGDKKILNALMELKVAYPRQVAILPFSEENEAEIFAGSDLYLMPSRVEPCGTAQLQAMRYGSVPVVHLTGGLRDTVRLYDAESDEGYAFGFEDYTPEAFAEALRTALGACRDGDLFKKLAIRCMEQDFGWEKPAKEYIARYSALLEQ